MKKFQIKRFESPEILAESFAQYLFGFINDNQKSIVNIALSGGNTPKLLFTKLLEKYRQKIKWSSAHFFWIDERCVDIENTESNFGEADRILFSKIEIPRQNLFRMIGEAHPTLEAERYANLLLTQIPQINKYPRFDLIVLGLGDDGHTASIFPGQETLLKSMKICEVSQHPVSGQKRITLTLQVINNAEKVVFLATGDSKSLKIKEIIMEESTSIHYPAAFINPVDGELTWYFDTKASKLI